MRWCIDVAMPIPFFFFFNDTATTEIYTLSLHDALPILDGAAGPTGGARGTPGAERPVRHTPRAWRRDVPRSVTYRLSRGIGERSTSPPPRARRNVHRAERGSPLANGRAPAQPDR